MMTAMTSAASRRAAASTPRTTTRRPATAATATRAAVAQSAPAASRPIPWPTSRLAERWEADHSAWQEALVQQALVGTFRYWARSLLGLVVPPNWAAHSTCASAAFLRWWIGSGAWQDGQHCSAAMVAAAWWRLGEQERRALVSYIERGDTPAV